MKSAATTLCRSTVQGGRSLALITANHFTNNIQRYLAVVDEQIGLLSCHRGQSAKILQGGILAGWQE